MRKSTVQVKVDSVNRNDDTECSTLEDSDVETMGSRNRQDHLGVYTFRKIRSFLQKTKNMKNVQVEDYFPDRKMFINSVATMMRGDSEEHFTAQEVFRLKKYTEKGFTFFN